MIASEIKQLIEERIAFAMKVGIHVDEASPQEARLSLPLAEGNLGAQGIVHGGATFTLAESAAFALGLAAFDETQVTFIVKAVDIRFRRPQRGDLCAIAKLDHEAREEIMARAASEGKVDLSVHVEILEQGGERQAEATVTLNLRRL